MSTLLMVLGAVACSPGAIFLIASSLLAPRPTKNRLAASRAKKSGLLADGVTGLRARALAAADDALDRKGRRAPLETLLEQADVPMRAGEALVLAVSATSAAFLLGLLFRGLLGGLSYSLLSSSAAAG